MKHRQLVEISKILDNTELSLANHNIQVLANKSDLYMNHDFKIIGDYEYYQSQEKYTHSECEIHCASRQSELPFNIDHFNHRIQAFTSPVWVQCETVVDKNNVYTVFFGSVQIFPTNKLTNGSVSIWSKIIITWKELVILKNSILTTIIHKERNIGKRLLINYCVYLGKITSN